MPESTTPATLTAWSLIILSRVAPFLRLKYFGLGRASLLRTGTTNRVPSTAATSPPPQMSAVAIPACPAMRYALARAWFSART